MLDFFPIFLQNQIQFEGDWHRLNNWTRKKDISLLSDNGRTRPWSRWEKEKIHTHKKKIKKQKIKIQTDIKLWNIMPAKLLSGIINNAVFLLQTNKQKWTYFVE